MLLYLPFGYLLSLLLERFFKDAIFDDTQFIPRSVFVLFYAVLIPGFTVIYLIFVIADYFEKDSEWLTNLKKKIRGF